MKPSFFRLWGTAILIGVLTVIGLLLALIGDGPWDVLSAATLGVPVIVGVWYGWVKPHVRKSGTDTKRRQ